MAHFRRSSRAADRPNMAGETGRSGPEENVTPAFGPRTWLVGKILPVLLQMAREGTEHELAVKEAIRLADLTLDTLSNRQPK